MLILYDIDMTLVETDHIGITLLENAGKDLFHDKFTAEGINFGGALDPVIISAMLKNNNVDVTQANIDAIRAHRSTIRVIVPDPFFSLFLVILPSLWIGPDREEGHLNRDATPRFG